MKMTTFRVFSYALLICLSLASCSKENVPDENNNTCTKLAMVHAHPFAPVTKGEQIDITVDSLEGATYFWTGPGNFQSSNQNNTVSTSAYYSDRGWYYVRISNDTCTDRVDSVYVDVKFPQGTPSCSPANNSATFSGPFLLGDQSYYFVSFGAATGGYGVTGNSTNGDFNLTLSAYWRTHDFDDGIYYTSNNPLPDYADIDKVYMSCVNQSIYWVAEADKPVFISHIAGKRSITFCGIQFSGSWGSTLYHTTVNAQITQP